MRARYSTSRDAGERRAACEAHHEAARAVVAATKAKGIPVPIFTGGGTGSVFYDGPAGLYTDLQCGSYAFMDQEYGVLEGPEGTLLDSFETALTVHSTAISQPRKGPLRWTRGLRASGRLRYAVLDLPGARYFFAGG